MSKYVVPTLCDGEWCRPARPTFYEQCCDCGLVHKVHYRVRNGKIEFRAWRDPRRTAKARRVVSYQRRIAGLGRNRKLDDRKRK